jgi:hypothetical protein
MLSPLRSVGQVFIPNDDAIEVQCRAIYESVAASEGFTVAGWRDVPVNRAAVGPVAEKTMPRMYQIFLQSDAGLTGDALERKLFIVRKLVEKEKMAKLGDQHFDFYSCSLSSRTIIYKVCEHELVLLRKRVGFFAGTCLPKTASQAKRGWLCNVLSPHSPSHPSPAGHAQFQRRGPLLLGPEGRALRHTLCDLPPSLLHQHQPALATGAAIQDAGAQW